MSWASYLITVFAVLLTVRSATNDVDEIILKRVRQKFSLVTISNQQVDDKKLCTIFTFQKSHKPLELAQHKISKLADLTDQRNFDDVLERILVPRF